MVHEKDRWSALILYTMQRTMQHYAAVFRTGEILNEGISKLEEVWESLSEMQVSDRSMIWNTDLVETLELENLLGQEMVSIKSAYNRTESRGADTHEDYPARDDVHWLKHTLSWVNQKGEMRVDYGPVHLHTLTDEMDPIPPKPRVH